jgi:hypothetical protein
MKRCPECGGNVSLVAKEGRTSPYKDKAALPIPSDMKILTCDKCGSEWFDEAACEALDEALEKAYQACNKASHS